MRLRKSPPTARSSSSALTGSPISICTARKRNAHATQAFGRGCLVGKDAAVPPTDTWPHHSLIVTGVRPVLPGAEGEMPRAILK